jgi:hypothetical protein
MFCNVVYARLAASCGTAEDRERLDREVHAPVAGWDAAQRNLYAAIAAAPDLED